MKIPPRYTITGKMLECISNIEALRIYFSSLQLPIQIKEKIQRISLLKSSLFSARIEGNPLDLSDLTASQPEEEKKREVFNIVEAVRFIDTQVKRGSITKHLLQDLHAIALKGIHSEAGRFRKEVSAIFNQAGVAVYMPPPPSEISQLLDDLLTYVNSDKEKFPLVAAFTSHLIFEKIHPFLDGNGRVGRLFIAAVLKAKDWDFTLTVPFEEYLDTHKDEYYFHLDRGMQDTNVYLIFMLEAFLKQAKAIKQAVEEEQANKDSLLLPPRQEEIYAIIKDHVIASFDIVRRRFLKVPERTLRFDLKKLLDKGLIVKIGKTRGSYYKVKK